MITGLARVAAVTAAALLTGCMSSPVTGQQAAAPVSAATARMAYPASWTLPNGKISPGAVQHGFTVRDICPHVNPALEKMRPGTAEKNKVYAMYGIRTHPAGKYEIDHIIPIELLGQAGASTADPALNLYPELNDKPDPVMIRKYHLSAAYVHNSKDILEDVLHQKVCAGTVPLATAQRDIATDWRAAYVRYVGRPA
jgi:hypothetical protein